MSEPNDPFAFFNQMWKGGSNNPFMPPLTAEEQQALARSAGIVREAITSLGY